MARRLLLGDVIPMPDPRVGDVCRIFRGGSDLGLWVPFAGCGGRSDGERVTWHAWMFAQFDAPEDHRSFSLRAVTAIEIPCEDVRAKEFWERLRPHIEG